MDGPSIQQEKGDSEHIGNSGSRIAPSTAEQQALELKANLPDKQSNLPAWIQAISACLIVIVTVVYTIFAGTQARKLTEEVKYSRQAADAAQKTLTLTRQQLVGTQAAILNLRLMYQPDGLMIVIENTGHVIGVNVHATLDVLRQSANQEPIGTPFRIQADLPDAGPITGVEPLVAWSQTYRSYEFGVTSEVWTNMRQSTKRETIRMEGRLTYENGFGDTINKSVCKIWYAHPQLGINSDQDWIDCGAYPAKLKFWADLEREELKKQRP